MAMVVGSLTAFVSNYYLSVECGLQIFVESHTSPCWENKESALLNLQNL